MAGKGKGLVKTLPPTAPGESLVNESKGSDPMPQIILHPTSRHPLIIYFLCLIIVSSLTMVVGAPPPDSVNEALPRWGVSLWAASLFFGAASILWGLKLQPRLGKVSVTGALFESVGMAMLAAAGILYATTVVIIVGWSALIMAGLVYGLSAACGYRYWMIHKQVKAYVDRKARETMGDGQQR